MLSGRYVKILGCLLFFLCLCLVILEFYPSSSLQHILEAVTWIVLVAAVLTVRSFGKWIAVALLLSGSFVYLTYGLPAGEMIEAVTVNVGLIGILLAVPLIGIAIRSGGYLRAIKYKSLLERGKGRSFSYRIAVIVAVILAPFLNVGTIPIVHDLAHKSLDRFHSKRMGMAVYRGFSSSFYWSPFGAMVILVTSLFGVRWSSILLFLLLAATCHLLLSFLVFPATRFAEDRWIEQTAHRQTMNERRMNRKILSLIMIMIGLILTSVVLDTLTGISMGVIVILIAFFYSLIWMFWLGRTRRFLIQSVRYFQRSFLQVRTEIVLFVSAGFFASAVAASPLNVYVIDYFEQLSQLPTHYFIIILFCIVIAIGFVGIHAVILITLIGTAGDASLFSDNPLFLPVALLYAVVLHSQASPFSAITIITSKTYHISNGQVIMKNALFNALLFVVLTICLVWIR